MLNNPQTKRLMRKIERFITQLEPMLFTKVGEVDFSAFETKERLHTIPDDDKFLPVQKGWTWNGENGYCWFKGSYTVPESLENTPLYVYPHMQGYEAMLWVNGKVFGNFATKIVYTSHGNHYCDLIKMCPKANEKIDLVIEWYGGHFMPGSAPYDKRWIKNYNYAYNGADICIKNTEINDFYFDLVTVYQLTKYLEDESFIKAEAEYALMQVHKYCYTSIEDIDNETFMDSIRKCSPILKEVLSRKGGDSTPKVTAIGHSHMDTAWLWHVGETVKKCARTYANQLALMEEYPEFMFFQSSACHSDFLLKNYPELFARIQTAVAQGKYEPNGGVWVECDCNITSGESMVRQFLWGQRFTRKYFNYTSDCFWLPDTFGYSGAIPQIMKGCDIKYFLTTKISWNDTNAFPYDSFWWEGIDGTKVFTHFNRMAEPEVRVMRELPRGEIRQKTVTNKKLLAYGMGDGGGGPEFEQIELARRLENLENVCKLKTDSVSSFMQELEASVKDPNYYKGELYLELHRGTLTNQHTIKRNNRKSEFALRDMELFTVNEAVKNSEIASSEKTSPLYELLLLNQFHDILPGTCINRAHEESRQQTYEIIEKATNYVTETVNRNKKENALTLINTLSFDRTDSVFADYKEGYIVDGNHKQQLYTDLEGNKKLIISGVTVPAFSSLTLKLVKGKINSTSAFSDNENTLETPFAKVVFAPNGTISSFVDKQADRELVGDGYNFNTFIMAEDLPLEYDNWDIDADILEKFTDVSKLISREVVSKGECAYIIRSKYQISEKSTLTQDMIFFADNEQVRFDTVMDWQDDHRFLKTAFDTTVMEDFARYEIQFGNVKRPTTRNNSTEQAKFELVNHKFTDLSETKFGVSILNDCKYGISVYKGQIRLSLHKGGNHPDYKGDHDCPHKCTYSFLPHQGSFSADSVIKPAYELNIPYVISNGTYELESLVNTDKSNIIVEAIKPCEDNEKAFIVRMYEAEGTFTNAVIKTTSKAIKVEETNMLEEVQSTLPSNLENKVVFKPFEIKTFKVTY